MKNIYLKIIAILILIFVTSCNDMIDADNNIIRKDITKDSGNQNLEGYYPNTPGCSWKYNILNLVSGKADEVTINITGEKLLPNGFTASVWEYKFKDSIDRNFIKYVRIINDTVTEWDLNHLNRTMFSYVIPFNIGTGWRTSQIAAVFNTVELNFLGEDTCRTLSEIYGNNIFGNNSHSYNIMRQCWTPFNKNNNYENEEIEFVPFFGIISIIFKDQTYLRSYGIDKEIEKWTLISYHIK